MSSALDVVELFDAEADTLKTTLARSKDAVASARTDLIKHRQWLGHHRVLYAESVRKQKRWLARQRAFRLCRQAAGTFALLLASVFLWGFRGTVRGFAYLRDLAWLGLSWIATRAVSLGLSLISLVSAGITRIATRALSLGLLVTGLVATGIASIATRVLALGLLAIELVSAGASKAISLGLTTGRRIATGIASVATKAVSLGRLTVRVIAAGISWIPTTTAALCLSLIGLISTGIASVATKAVALGRSAIGLFAAGITWISTTSVALGLLLIGLVSAGGTWTRPRARALARAFKTTVEHQFSVLLGQTRLAGKALIQNARHAKQAYEKRKRDAALLRRRMEHERLQNRIHTLSELDRPRMLNGNGANGLSSRPRQVEQDRSADRSNPQEWAQLRKLVREARRLSEAQPSHMAALRREDGSLPQVTGPALTKGLGAALRAAQALARQDEEARAAARARAAAKVASLA